ncbi:HWE histidine kinase domain-containing protein [Arenibaculum pallidiluteum]|uniref:HWE histidine kinase domain-containing protein n=1 Tax=Arenibaculum pallidiluteum TaxID=2812559 RepID=UPI001A95CD9C|nr:HWE histidine kinase domain-containing protein [Arenibaculum pallidiluteum]
MPYPTPLHDASGRLVGTVNMLVDHTYLKSSKDRQRMLINELDHRAKNILVVAQAMLRLTRANSVKEYVTAVQGRIAALARIHTQVADNQWKGVDLGSLVRSEMEPFRSEVGGLVIKGPQIFLTPVAA